MNAPEIRAEPAAAAQSEDAKSTCSCGWERPAGITVELAQSPPPPPYVKTDLTLFLQCPRCGHIDRTRRLMGKWMAEDGTDPPSKSDPTTEKGKAGR